MFLLKINEGLLRVIKLLVFKNLNWFLLVSVVKLIIFIFV